MILSQLRELARGIYPAVLADAGLRGALEDMAESSTDLAIEVSGSPLRRYRTVAETVAYRVVEAAIGDARRRHAGFLTISAVDRDDELVLDLCDDGGPSPASMPALEPQISALGGRTGGQLQRGRGMRKARAAMRVVIADDAKLIRSGLATLLGEAGIESVGEAGSADELLGL